jgi:polysaccharide pyruvyl transferase WcaK-like protein
VCTEPFVPTVRAMSEIVGLPDYPYAVVAHPIGRLSEPQLRERVEQALPQVVRLLVRRP